jgi:hypothetical protein
MVGVRRDRLVYFAQAKDGGPIKIGQSCHPRIRVYGIRAKTKVKLELLGIMTDGTGNLEGELHTKFSRERIQGEWFTPSKRLVDYIRKNAKHLPTARADTNPYRDREYYEQAECLYGKYRKGFWKE